jgi:hypothetical protein
MDRTEPDRTLLTRSGSAPVSNGGTDSIFLSLDRLGPSRMDRGPSDPWTARV